MEGKMGQESKDEDKENKNKIKYQDKDEDEVEKDSFEMSLYEDNEWVFSQ